MENMYRVDFHTHILPNFDDGSANLNESEKMLCSDFDKGDGSFDKSAVFLTPHFNTDLCTDFEGFFQRRLSSFYMLSKRIIKQSQNFKNNAKGLNLPSLMLLVLGAEVYISKTFFSLSDYDLRRAAVGDLILLELPYGENFSKDSTKLRLKNVFSRIKDAGLKIVLAHAERYLNHAGNEPDVISELIELAGYPAQLNCDSIINDLFGYPGFYDEVKKYPATITLKKFIEKGITTGEFGFLGTDCHNMTDRPPRFLRAEKYIRKNFSDADFEGLMKLSRMLVDDILSGKFPNTNYFQTE